MLKDFLLLPEGDSTTLAADTARRIDNFQQQEYLPSDPLMRFQDDQGMGGFLSAFYEVIFTLARLIPYNTGSFKQKKLVQLMLKLRKLPAREFKIWGVCYVISSCLLYAVPSLCLLLWISTDTIV